MPVLVVSWFLLTMANLTMPPDEKGNMITPLSPMRTSHWPFNRNRGVVRWQNSSDISNFYQEVIKAVPLCRPASDGTRPTWLVRWLLWNDSNNYMFKNGCNANNAVLFELFGSLWSLDCPYAAVPGFSFDGNILLFNTTVSEMINVRKSEAKLCFCCSIAWGLWKWSSWFSFHCPKRMNLIQREWI